MEKLYLPTSTLNFNNIFSSESISPLWFYGRRNFGYKRFEPVEPNSFKNSILLYSHYPAFEIKDEEQDNYPMIIEISKSMVSDKIKKVKTIDNIEIFQIASTIYLNPFEIKVFFQSENHLRITLLKAEASLETKMVTVYKSCLSFTPNLSNAFKWNKSNFNEIEDIEESKLLTEVELDVKINKIKGFAYCYLIGASSNMPAEFLELKRIIKDIRNITSGLINIYQSQYNLESKSYSKKQNNSKETIKKLEEFNNKVTRFVGLAEIIEPQNKKKQDFEREVFKQFGINESEFEKIINLLKSYKSYKETLYEHFQWAIQNKNQATKSSFWISNFEKLSIYINSIFAKQELTHSNFRIEDIEIVFSLAEDALSKHEDFLRLKNEGLNIEQAFAISNLRLTSIFDNKLKGKSEFYQSIINALIDLSIDNIEHFKSLKADITRTFGKILKEFVEDVQKKDWTKSPERAYINSLLDNIESYQPFDLKSHSSEVLQSFTAFIMKGEDLEKLKDFLINNNIQDFRISFGLWGATFGFASLPKTISNNILMSDTGYLTSFFRILTKQLFDYDMSTFHELQIIKEPKIDYVQPPKENIIEKKIEKTFEITPAKHDVLLPSNISDKILCPECNSEMKLRKGQWGEFYGCTKFPDCKGTRQLKEDIKNSEIANNLSSLIIEYVAKNGHCKISDLLLFVNDKTKKGYKVGDIESYIKQNLIEELELKKKERSSGVMKRDKGMFDSK
ncbi:MAG: topoisomerase DNA-binding C4 zinc finger domain-containing protein [Candidatus Delongbacteria bacterium]|nr:topoisomerase DNA-binding C4 zinc finger domain-containing protein [Candidatus Delongbacteria bacterium]